MKALKLIALLTLLYPNLILSVPYSEIDPQWDPINNSKNTDYVLLCTTKDKPQVNTPSTNVCQEGSESKSGDASKILRNDQVREP